MENDKPLGLIQGWYKQFLFIRFVRISYGPLWIVDVPSPEQIQGTFRAIKTNWCFKKLSALSIAPNLTNILEYKKILSQLRFLKTKQPRYQSGWVDLSQSVDVLRTQLRQSWRRHIKDAEKMGLTFCISKDEADFRWLITCFEKFRKEKNFFGHDIALLEALYNNSFDFAETSVAIVSRGDERLTGILISYHGSCCTPLITWIGQNGRDMNAGNFLIWNCLLYAKNKGCLWFDLGSTTSNNFKARLPNIPYELIGEYYAFI